MAWARATQLLGKREHRRCDRAEAATALPRRMAIDVHEAMLVASFACHRNVRKNRPLELRRSLATIGMIAGKNKRAGIRSNSPGSFPLRDQRIGVA